MGKNTTKKPMTNKKQTAVDWLIKQTYTPEWKSLQRGDIICKAKEMGKEQIIEAHAVGRIKECSGINTDGEHYYKETYEQ